jgi:flagellar basal-body rod protein FlgB
LTFPANNDSTTIMFDRLENELSPQRAALNVRAYRQELLASNIANADTPNYKARDIDFKTAYNTALSGRSEGGLSMNRTAARHLPGTDSSPMAGALRYRTEYQSAADGNTVNMDIERAAFAENAIQMEAMLTFINGRFRSLQSAIQGQ